MGNCGIVIGDTCGHCGEREMIEHMLIKDYSKADEVGDMLLDNVCMGHSMHKTSRLLGFF